MIFDLLFPRRCLSCGQWGQYFCQACQKKVKAFEIQICPVCGKPAISGKTHAQCQTKYSLDGLISIFPYKGVIRKAIIKLKYRFITDLAEELINLATEDFSLSFVSRQSFVFIPIPLHSRRKLQRGFNQTEVLGKILAEKFNQPIQTELLKRQKHTKPQTELEGKERKANVKGVFQIAKGSKSMICNSKLILFDDVWTTGSTLKEAARVLKRAGAKKVWGLTLAR